jgi:hypothetical protein
MAGGLRIPLRGHNHTLTKDLRKIRGKSQIGQTAKTNTKPKNRLGTATVTTSITQRVLALLKKLTDTHWFGRNVNETALQILSAEVKRMVMSGEMNALASKAPVVVRSENPGEDEGDTTGESESEMNRFNPPASSKQRRLRVPMRRERNSSGCLRRS